MNVLVVLGATMLLVGSASAQVNPGFEEWGENAVLTGWTVHPPDQDGKGYLAFAVPGEVPEGETCAQLGWYDDEAQPLEEGWLYQDVPGEPLRGRRVRLTASACMRSSGGFGDRGRVVIQVWRRGSAGYEDGMLDRPLRTDQAPEQAEDWTLKSAPWQDVALYADVPEDADWVRVGLVLRGAGDAWLDDVRLEAIGEAGAGLQAPAPLVGRALDNVTAFARLLGYVRHFHPSDAAVDADWASFALVGVRMVENAADPADLSSRLQTIFAPLAPALRVAPTGEELPVPPELAPPARGFAFVVWWEHKGYGQEGSPVYESDLRRGRLRGGVLPEGAPDPADAFRAELPGGVTCAVPLALYQQRGRTLPAGQAVMRVPALPRTMRDRSRRLANVVLAWNVLQHFYPYFDRVSGDWTTALREALGSAATDQDEHDLALTLRRMMHHLEDGHGWVKHPSDGRVGPLLEWGWVEDAVLVTRTLGEGEQRTVAGEEVVSIDGVATAEALARAERLVSGATASARRASALGELYRGPEGSRLVLELETPEGERRIVHLPRRRGATWDSTRPERVAEVEPGLWYVDLDRITDGDWQDVLPDLADARGIVFDLRGYPKHSPVWGHFVEEELESPFWDFPRVRRPDGEDTVFDTKTWKLPVLDPHLDAEIVVLTGERAQSAAETYLSFAEQYELGEILGSASAGTNGNINPFRLPGGYEITWTGMRVRKQDGSPHHGVGILPTVPVERTRQGVIEGRDEVLEAGLAFLRERTAAPR